MSKPEAGKGTDHLPHQERKFTAVNPKRMRESTLHFLQDVGSALLVQMAFPCCQNLGRSLLRFLNLDRKHLAFPILWYPTHWPFQWLQPAAQVLLWI